jgi:hypothetical protein
VGQLIYGSCVHAIGQLLRSRRAGAQQLRDTCAGADAGAWTKGNCTSIFRLQLHRVSVCEPMHEPPRLHRNFPTPRPDDTDVPAHDHPLARAPMRSGISSVT